MRITVEFFGLPTVSSRIGKKTDVALAGKTVMDLISQLSRRFGPKVRQALCDPEGNLDLTIQVMVNDVGFLPREAFSRKALQNGDTVKFLLLAGGG